MKKAVGCVQESYEERRNRMSNMLQTKTAEEILSTVFKPKEFIIDGLLTQGLYVLAGAQKVRKSWMAMDICLSIATGVPVLGRDTIQGSSIRTSVCTLIMAQLRLPKKCLNIRSELPKNEPMKRGKSGRGER